MTIEKAAPLLAAWTVTMARRAYLKKMFAQVSAASASLAVTRYGRPGYRRAGFHMNTRLYARSKAGDERHFISVRDAD